MICPNCGNECDENQMFCSKCGTKINSFMINEPKPITSNHSFDNIIGGMSEEETEENEEMEDYVARDIQDKKREKHTVLDEEEEFEEENYHSKSKPVYKREKDRDESRGNRQRKKKMSGGKKAGLVALLTVALVIIAVFSTIGIKKSSMTKKFDRYYARGNQYYENKNYKDAKTQYINASNNAFTREQKIKSYEMVCQMDGIIGGYENEEMKYLEMLIDVDSSNIQYYKDLIILYQNNEQENKINSLINAAPSSLREELQSFDGTIPVASEKEGTYDKPIEIELTAAEGVKIYYTTDGSSVKDSSSKKAYTMPIVLDEEGTYTLRAYSEDKNGKESKEMSVKYILDFKQVNAPVVSLKSGTYDTQEEVKVSADDDCQIYYTKNGTTPTKKSKLYKKPIKIPKGNTLYYFIAIDAEGVASPVVTRVYNYQPRKISYNEAINRLNSYLVSSGKLENSYGEFSNGNVAYLNFVKMQEIDNQDYYIISCDIENEDGKNQSSDTYAVSCLDGSCTSASSSNGQYYLKNNSSSQDDDRDSNRDTEE